jgi:hypothetical protein
MGREDVDPARKEPDGDKPNRATWLDRTPR